MGSLLALGAATSACRPAIDDNAPDPVSTSSTSTAIGDGTITTAKIADGAVTAAKLSAAYLPLAGGVMGGAIDMGGKSLTGLATPSNSSDATTKAYVDAQVSAGVADGSVTSTKITDGTIAAVDIASDAVTTAKILDGTIAAADIASDAVTAAKILDGTIVNADINASAAIAVTKIAPSGTNGYLLTTTAGATGWAAPFVPRDYQSGIELTYVDATHIDISAGQVSSADYSTMITQSAAITGKDMNAAWSVGSAGGGLVGATMTLAASKTYYVYSIRRSDTGVVDVCAVRSDEAFAYPAGYDSKRYRGSFLTGGDSAIISFIQVGRKFFLNSTATAGPYIDINGAAGPGSTATNYTLTVPLGIKVFAFGNLKMKNNSTAYLRAYSPDLYDETVTIGNCSVHVGNATAPTNESSFLTIRTNTSGQIRLRGDAGGGASGVYWSTEGWEDDRL